ncbi:uncharacterized protein TNCT_291921 [Trichonephila clavata]|uniref:Uncharacterized protein n=1 Tax=Trichonephila clavata TaxID=2740835 RepID=A0A8X6H8T4_TRICU|nr:uncharacterized protein TNCT_291921 [Trichonephila clavata]
MCTKAVYLELVFSLSSSAFLSALRRFAPRRGYPSDIYSDNGIIYRRLNWYCSIRVLLAFSKYFFDMHPKMFKILLLVFVGIAVTEAIVCTKDTCARIRCKNVTEKECNENQVFVKKGGTCGCCDACRIKEGSSCVPVEGGPPGCEDGTTCMEVGDGYICARDCR